MVAIYAVSVTIGLVLFWGAGSWLNTTAQLAPREPLEDSIVGCSQAVARGFIPRAFPRGAQGPALRRVSLVSARRYVHFHAASCAVVLSGST